MDMPRQRKQTTRYTVGQQELMENLSELEDSGDDDSDDDGSGKKGRGKKGNPNKGVGRGRGRRARDEEAEYGDGPIEHYLRSELFKVEKHLLIFGYVCLFGVIIFGTHNKRWSQRTLV